MQEKACAIVLRTNADVAQVLMFRHPLAGVQLVKGGIEPGETPLQAAKRELFEESGLDALEVTALETINFLDLGQRWHICLCKTGDAPNAWVYKTSDDGGQLFSFFWQPIADPLPKDTGAPYRKVIETLDLAKIINA